MYTKELWVITCNKLKPRPQRFHLLIVNSKRKCAVYQHTWAITKQLHLHSHSDLKPPQIHHVSWGSVSSLMHSLDSHVPLSRLKVMSEYLSPPLHCLEVWFDTSLRLWSRHIASENKVPPLCSSHCSNTSVLPLSHFGDNQNLISDRHFRASDIWGHTYLMLWSIVRSEEGWHFNA